MVGSELILLLSLIATNALQFWFWSRDHHRLVDKLMSRNYADYVLSQNPPDQTSISRGPDEVEVDDKEVLKELNGLFGS